MKPILHNILSSHNSHERDKNIKFFEEDHKYIILSDPDTKYTSVTTWNHSHFPKFDADEIIKNMMNGKGWKEGHKYWGLSAEQIKSKWSNNGSSEGTNLHFEIECFMNNKIFETSYTHKELYENYMLKYEPTHDLRNLEWKYFLNFVHDYPNLKPYRTEWTIYHEDLKIAGSIDMVYENEDGTLSIYDWKRCKNITRINGWNKFAIKQEVCHLPDSNFWHYALQLNTYKAILEAKYEKKVKDLYLVRLHPESDEKNYELIKLPDLSTEMKDLFEARKKEITKENA
jgi:ATP-dependent exoDNAse (exonuclease V) beta subunit